MSDNSWYEKGKLPPVGSRVKVSIDSCSCRYVREMHGKDAEILMHRISSTGHAVAVFCIIDDDGFNSYHALTSDNNFRPIKTERELAIDNMLAIAESAAEKMPNQTYIDSESLQDAYKLAVISALYDAGYRKTNTPD